MSTTTDLSLQTLLELARDGHFLEIAEGKFRELNLEALRRGAAGSLTLTIKAIPGDDGTVDFELSDKLTLPKPKPVRATMFIDKASGAARTTKPAGKQTEIAIGETTAPASTAPVSTAPMRVVN